MIMFIYNVQTQISQTRTPKTLLVKGALEIKRKLSLHLCLTMRMQDKIINMTADKSFQKLEMTVIHQNYIHD
jgi:hypothetical protein